jgi:dipicolinate synthase subunit B
MGVKAMIRNKKPIVIAFASNDGLSGSLKNIATLLERKNFFFVPLRQDDFINKPSSLVCDFSLTEKTISMAIMGKQLQPILLPPLKKED